MAVYMDGLSLCDDCDEASDAGGALCDALCDWDALCDALCDCDALGCEMGVSLIDVLRLELDLEDNLDKDSRKLFSGDETWISVVGDFKDTLLPMFIKYPNII